MDAGLIYVGIGLAVLGVGLGIGRIGGSAMDAIARHLKLQEKSKEQCLLQQVLSKEQVLLLLSSEHL